MKSEQWVLEWNKETNFFHVQTLSKSLASAQEAFLKDKQIRWSIIMVGSYDAVTRMADTQRHRLEERDKAVAHE
jgi:hypothetical protein